jgi:hypothetical protein
MAPEPAPEADPAFLAGTIALTVFVLIVLIGMVMAS